LLEFHHFSTPHAHHRPNPARNIDAAEFTTMAQSIKPHNRCPKQSLTDRLEMMLQAQLSATLKHEGKGETKTRRN